MPLDRKTPWDLLAATARLRSLIPAEGICIVHARSRAPAFPAYLAARAAGVPLVTTYHGVYNARSSVKRWYNRIMTRGVVTIANSEFTREHVLAEHHLPPGQVVAIARGTDLKRFDPDHVSRERVTAMRERFGLAWDDERLVLILAARLTRWKGQLLMIDAVAGLKAWGLQDSVRLILAGDDQGRTGYLDEIAHRISEHGLEEVVRVTGHLEDMPAAYLAADAAVAPSIEPEAFGRGAVEPQIMGIPVLAADHGAVRETVADGVTGFRLKPGDVEAWSLGVRRLIALGGAGRRAMGQAAMERARGLYSVEAMCDATLAVYRDVLGARRT
jgi:glycosyltransferase involved in cell wall biosynthesis